MTKALVFVMAGLHAKGFVHLDLKPENLMVFDGALKLIDVDGCVKVGMSIAITNPSISFSPCYCSPEWACFLLAENEAHIVATPGLDVWSVGCTICEFVTLDAILKPMYANFLRHSHSHREAGFLFMDWLSSIKKSPTPKRVVAFDKEFADMVSEWMLVTDKGTRKTCAECLSSPYLTKSKLHHSKTNPLTVEADDKDLEMPKQGDRKLRTRAEDTSSKAVHTGTLWKLNTGQDGKDGSQWLQRDMWVANNGSLCYFSQKDNKRLVLLDSHKLHDAEIKDIKVPLAKDNAFEIKTAATEGDEEAGSHIFAAESFEDLQVWMGYLSSAAHMDAMPTMRFDASFGQDLMKFKLSVKNRRMKLEKGAEKEGGFEPVFKGTIWKSKANGDIMKESEWFQRESWLSRNGSLVYYSVREQRELIYYTAADVGRAKISKLPDGASIKPFAFEVVLPPCEGMEFLSGQFAAETEELRDQWIAEFAKFKVDS
jgi:serine/threonine protein kinase